MTLYEFWFNKGIEAVQQGFKCTVSAGYPKEREAFEAGRLCAMGNKS